MAEDEPRIEISVKWAGKPPEGVPEKVVLKKSDFAKIAELKSKLETKSCPKCGETEYRCGFCRHTNVSTEMEPCVSCIDNLEHPNWQCDCGHEGK